MNTKENSNGKYGNLIVQQLKYEPPMSPEFKRNLQ